MSTISIALVDDHPLMVEAIVTLLARIPSLKVLATGTTAKDLVEISSRHRPDILIADLTMNGDVFEAIAAAGKIAPDTKIIAFTAATGVDYAIRALDAGAVGYVLKGSNADELVHAIQSVQQGQTFITETFAVRSLRRLGTHHCAGGRQK